MHVRRKNKNRMKENCLHRLAKYVLIAALLPFSWAALEAKGGTKPQATLVLGIKPPPFPIGVEQPGCLASPQFNLYSNAGDLVGQAVACVTSVSTKTNRFAVRTTTAHFVFDLTTGQIEADLTIWESTSPSFCRPVKWRRTAMAVMASALHSSLTVMEPWRLRCINTASCVRSGVSLSGFVTIILSASPPGAK